MSIYLIKTPPKTSIGDQILFATNNASLIKKNKTLVTGIPNNNVAILALVALITADKLLSEGGDESATIRFHNNLKVFNKMYYQNGLFLENMINISNDPNVAIKLGYTIQKTRGPGNKASASGKNTNNKGELKITLLKVKVANHSDVYGGLVTNAGIGVAVKFGVLGKSRGLVRGFTSGGEYSIYAIPVDSDGNEGAPTDSFIIRIN